MDWGKNNFQAALQWPGCLFQRTLDVLSKVMTSSTIHQLQVISCLLENLSRAHKRRTPRKNNDASGRKFPIWTLWFWEAQYSPSPLGILLPGSRGLLQLSTTFTPSTSRRVLDNLFCFPNFINHLCFASSTEEFPRYYHTRHLSPKCRDSSYFKLFVLKIMLSSFLISSDYFKSLSQWIKSSFFRILNSNSVIYCLTFPKANTSMYSMDLAEVSATLFKKHISVGKQQNLYLYLKQAESVVFC